MKPGEIEGKSRGRRRVALPARHLLDSAEYNSAFTRDGEHG